jgi:hypothetical protein
VEVVNNHGTVRALAGDVRLYELPPFNVDLIGLPRPVVPGMPAVMVPPVFHALPAVPVVSTADHPVPRIQLPPLDAVANALGAVSASTAPMQRVAAAIAGGAAGLADATVWTHLPAAPGSGLTAAATKTVMDVHGVLADARDHLKDRVAADVATALRQGSTRP